jgi:hypothetical protein
MEDIILASIEDITINAIDTNGNNHNIRFCDFINSKDASLELTHYDIRDYTGNSLRKIVVSIPCDRYNVIID